MRIFKVERELRALERRDVRFRRPFGLTVIVAWFVWFVAAMFVSAFGSVLLSFGFGAVSGVPLFFPTFDYLWRGAIADSHRYEFRTNRILGRERVAAHREGVVAKFKLDEPDAQRALEQFGTVLKWTPTAMCAFGSVFGLAVAAMNGGFGGAMTAAISGVGAPFALLFARRVGREMPTPTAADWA